MNGKADTWSQSIMFGKRQYSIRIRSKNQGEGLCGTVDKSLEEEMDARNIRN